MEEGKIVMGKKRYKGEKSCNETNLYSLFSTTASVTEKTDLLPSKSKRGKGG